MSAQQHASRPRSPADTAARRAWWSLAFYPVSSIVAFVIGEGLYAALTDDPADPALWQVLVAGVPALVVFAVPGILAVTQGRRAMRLGRPDGRVPAVIGAVIALSFIGVNLLSYVATLVLG
ncbi:hypothetical protein FB382_000811 [Nocardioides ginsengisegetis]|uniref:Uncharacterized protein n=1 Tax=Nocardioides ginsengisegetis TaxID=661491 RepID=A0A7W3IXM9_9ACTN|nr:hypothetical protein [Nocardioides ginsengisegetis]MBA8802520.1 hypothetical protein [Nocardioides ginsengisegetis]